jgi:hypothetical protein
MQQQQSYIKHQIRCGSSAVLAQVEGSSTALRVEPDMYLHDVFNVQSATHVQCAKHDESWTRLCFAILHHRPLLSWQVLP